MKADTFLVFVLTLILTGCAAHRVLGSQELAQGHLGTTRWKDCKYNPKAGQVLCKCSVFDVKMDAKTGDSVMSCAQVQP